MMTDEDFDFLEKVFNKLRSARNTKSWYYVKKKDS